MEVAIKPYESPLESGQSPAYVCVKDLRSKEGGTTLNTSFKGAFYYFGGCKDDRHQINQGKPTVS